MSVDPVAETARSYDLIVDAYEQRQQAPHPGLAGLRERFAERLPLGGRVVDVGCGPGHHAQYFASHGLTPIGLDVSVGMVTRTRAHGLSAVLGDARRPPFRPSCAQGVWSSASLLHVPQPDVPATLSAWRGLLALDGWLGLSTSLGDDQGWEAVPYPADSQHAGVELHRWFVHHPRERLMTMIGDAGFEILEVGERQTHRRWLEVLARAR